MFATVGSCQLAALKSPKASQIAKITEAVTLLFKSSSNIRKFKEAPNGPMASLRQLMPSWQEQHKRIEAEGQKLSPDLVYLKQCRIRNIFCFGDTGDTWAFEAHVDWWSKNHEESKTKMIEVHWFMSIQLIQLHRHWKSMRLLNFFKDNVPH